jgi:hypothetical protein
MNIEDAVIIVKHAVDTATNENSAPQELRSCLMNLAKLFGMACERIATHQVNKGLAALKQKALQESGFGDPDLN